MIDLAVPFGEELVHYAIGAASCGVPGVAAGIAELWRAHGRLTWERVVEPALRLARDGVPMPPAHVRCLEMLQPVLTLDAGARIYAPGGTLLRDGELLQQPGLVRALELLRDEGADSVYSGSIAEALLALCDERGGVVTREDLAAYRATWSEPVEVAFAGTRFLTRRGLSGVPTCSPTAPARRCRRAHRDARPPNRHRRRHDEPRQRRRRRQHLRPHDEPRPRLRRLPPRPRPAPEQHARGGRPRPRRVSPRPTDELDDGAEHRARRRRARARDRRGGRHAVAHGARGRFERCARAQRSPAGGDRRGTRAPGRRARARGARRLRGWAGGARTPWAVGASVAGPPPLLRRSQRDRAERSSGGSSSERFGTLRGLSGRSTESQPT